MLGHFDQRAIEQAAVLLKVAKRHSSDELDAALKAGRLAIEYSLKEINATGDFESRSDRSNRCRSVDSEQ